MPDKGTQTSSSQVKEQVSKIYAQIALQRDEGSRSGDADHAMVDVDAVAQAIGYSMEELKSIPDGANLGVGCGNPGALVDIQPGERVLDLGSGAGLDCFVAANIVGPTGQVIGVDMTRSMVDKAKRGSVLGGYINVAFSLGDIESLPIKNQQMDVVLSNCVIDLAPNKDRVFQEAFRVLKAGGRLALSDTLRTRELDDDLKTSLGPYLPCLPGGIMRDRYLQMVESAGFDNIEVVDEAVFPVDLVFEDEFIDTMVKDGIASRAYLDEVARSVVSVKLRATKPQHLLKA